MKLKNILFTLIAVLTCIFGIKVNAETTAPSSFNLVSGESISTTYYLPGSNFNNGSVFVHKKKADGRFVYCTEIHKSSGSGTFYRSKELDSRYVYVLQNGYANTSLFGNENKDYFTTALAIWYLSSPNDSVFKDFNIQAGTYNGNSSDIVAKLKELINGASNYKNVDPTISIANSSNNLSLSSDGKYYISEAMSVKTSGIITGNTYNVSLSNSPEGTIVTDINGNVKNTFNTNDKFIVKVLKSSVKSTSISFDVNVSATGKINRAYLYTPSSSAYQSVAALYPENKNISATTKLNLNIITEVQISKVDATTGSELPGATLVVKDSTGKVVEEWVSTNEVHVIKGLKPGKYTLTETIAPDGYRLSSETIEFTIKEDGSVTKVEMKNYPKNPVVISKIDATTGSELPGAHLVVKDSKGKVIDEWDSTNEAHIIADLKPGNYTLTETIAPEGYKLSEETVKFTVKEDGSVTKVEMKNYPKNTIVISKQDITTSEEVPGAHLELKDEDGKVIYAWISGDTPFVIEGGLKPGKYYLTETMAPEGYELSTETVEFIVKEDGTVDGDIIMYNKPETIINVPSTSSFKTITASLIGIIIIGLGSLIIYKNYKKNEEN